MIKVIFEREQGSLSIGVICKIKTGKIIVPSSVNYILNTMTSIENSIGYSVPNAGIMFAVYNDGYIIRNNSSSSIVYENRTFVNIEGNFNYDDIRIVESFGNRVEIRNENDVLITDNGQPWIDGTYPPDAKNRAGLAGLHAAPAVINPELETALMGDETNKERVQE